MDDCLFCKIASGQIPASIVREDDELVAFNDINPQAPLHALIIPRRHIPTLNDLATTDEGLIGHMLRFAAAIAAEKGYADRGVTAPSSTAIGKRASRCPHPPAPVAGRGLGWPPG